MTSTRTMGRDIATLRVLGGAEPLGFAAGDENLYRYVGNDPTNEIDPTGLAGKTVESGVKGVTFFIEWFPDRGTGELKIIANGVEQAIIKWVINQQTGELIGNVVSTHGGKVLPGVAQSTLKKIMPKLATEIGKNVARIGGTWTLTRLKTFTPRSPNPGIGRPKPTGGGGFIGGIIGVLGILDAMAGTADAAEIQPPARIKLNLDDLGITEAEAIELAQTINPATPAPQPAKPSTPAPQLTNPSTRPSRSNTGT
jgi:hypothetical protein